MKYRITYAYLKGLSNRTRMAFSLLEYFLSFQFLFRIDDVKNRFSTKINHKIKNISGNIGVIAPKLGTNNVSQAKDV